MMYRDQEKPYVHADKLDQYLIYFRTSAPGQWNQDAAAVAEYARIYGTEKAERARVRGLVCENTDPVWVGGTFWQGKVWDELGQNITFLSTQTVDGVDVSAHDHSGAGQGGTVAHGSLSDKGTMTHATIDSHDHSGPGYGGQVEHDNLADKGITTHANIDAHIAAASAHGVSGNVMGKGDLNEMVGTGDGIDAYTNNAQIRIRKVQDSNNPPAQPTMNAGEIIFLDCNHASVQKRYIVYYDGANKWYIEGILWPH